MVETFGELYGSVRLTNTGQASVRLLALKARLPGLRSPAGSACRHILGISRPRLRRIIKQHGLVDPGGSSLKDIDSDENVAINC